ncbi:MAG: adenylyl-sulfate kinase [Gemmatimonadaceae bacterium]
MSGAGKSTLARAVADRLRKDAIRLEILDGDEIREHLSKGLGFSREDRDTNIRRIAYVAELLTRNGVGVITAAISPYADTRDEARRAIGDFIEVYVRASLDTCIGRDPKGMYRKAIAGEIKTFTGISDPYEPPTSPALVVDTDRETVQQGVDRIVATLQELGYLRQADA